MADRATLVNMRVKHRFSAQKPRKFYIEAEGLGGTIFITNDAVMISGESENVAHNARIQKGGMNWESLDHFDIELRQSSDGQQIDGYAATRTGFSVRARLPEPLMEMARDALLQGRAPSEGLANVLGAVQEHIHMHDSMSAGNALAVIAQKVRGSTIREVEIKEFDWIINIRE